MSRRVKAILVLLISLVAAMQAQGPRVLSVNPPFNSIAASLQPPISVVFDMPMVADSFSEMNFAVWGDRSGRMKGAISLSFDGTTATFLPFIKCSTGERITVSLSKALKAQNGYSLEGFTWSFRAPITHPTQARFSHPVAYNEGAQSMRTIDLNKDGYPDVVLSSGALLLNDGAGRLTHSGQLPNADVFGQLAVGDINCDGATDILYRSADSLEIALGDGKANFDIRQKPPWFSGFQIVDLNNDGHPDIVGYNNLVVNPPYDTTSFWGVALNDGSGQFMDTVWLGAIAGYIRDMVVDDVDNDGFLDVVLAVQPITTPNGTFGMHGFMVFRNNGHGQFQHVDKYTPVSSLNLVFPEHLALADYNGDGYVDVAILGDMGGWVLLNLGTGIFGTDSSHSRRFWGPEAMGAFTCGDFDGNGFADLLVSGYRTPFDTSAVTYYTAILNCSQVFQNCGGQAPFRDTLGYSFITYSVEAADLDMDGDLDLIHAGDQLLVAFNSDSIMSVGESYVVPPDFAVHQNYPNPFNGKTLIPIDVSSTSRLIVIVYDITGRAVKRLLDQTLPPGNYLVTLDCSDINQQSWSSGIYFISVRSTRRAFVLRAVLIR
jgi:hypothetical protein